MDSRECILYRNAYFKYYNKTEIDANDIEMLDRLARAMQIEYSEENGKAYARATKESKRLHDARPSAISI
ncbi:MAG: hypothetical protein FWD81_02060 [Methanomassiliicoccaceae archaeon]|nr:hypothetical protein [Methanomassiliicoccaceae archaeon]